jgi:uncharacterized cupin superfamily protein
MSAAQAKKPVVNIADVPMVDRGHSEKFAVKWGRIGPHIGLAGLGCAVHVVPPGKRAFPFHVHHANEELFFILSGSGEYRFGDKTYLIKAGDLLAGPPGGPELAHQIINTGAEEMSYLGISTMITPEAVDYPDSGKFAVMSRPDPGGDPRKAGLRFFGRKETSLDYWDGE